MQLILDAEDIDISRNMSTIEHESLNEKFLDSKVIEHLSDDLSNGNKENIQTQENIISEDGEEDVVGTDKDIAVSADVALTDDLNKENSKEFNGTKNENAESLDDLTEKISSIGDPEPTCDSKVMENENEEKSQPQINDVIINEVQIEDTDEQQSEENLEEEPNQNEHNETREAKLEKKLEENSTEKTNGDDKTKFQNTVEEPLMAKEVENKDEKIKIANEEGIEVNEAADVITENDLQAELNQDKVPSLEIDTQNNFECSEAKTTSSLASNITLGTIKQNNAIEIDDEDAKTNESNIESNVATEKDIAIEIDDEDVKINEENSDISKESQKVNENVNVIEEAKANDENITLQKNSSEIPPNDSSPEIPQKDTSETKRFCKLSNNLDIFSDDEEDSTETSKVEPQKDSTPPSAEKQCINLDDDDDIMVIDEDSNVKDSKIVEDAFKPDSDNIESSSEKTTPNEEILSESTQAMDTSEKIEMEKPLPSQTDKLEVQEPVDEAQEKPQPSAETTETAAVKAEEAQPKIKKPLLPKNFIKTYKKNLADMTRDELEEFCILKIVESIVDRSNLGEIKSQLKNLTQTMDECKKKCLMLTKQNKDLQVVLKSVQEEQRTASDVPITPLKITRSVGMQVVMMVDKSKPRAKATNGTNPSASSAVSTPSNKSVKAPNNAVSNNKIAKEKTPNNQQIPVPRLVPALPAVKNSLLSTNNNSPKQIGNNATPNGVRPASKAAEKRPRSQSVTVDLTDDEPPIKLQPIQRSPVNQPVRVAPAPSSNLLTYRYAANMNSPRKVYIPISAPQGQNVRPGQTIMLKPVTGIAPRQRCPPPHLAKVPQVGSPVRLGRIAPNRHPAPLPEVSQQYQAPNWKNLPPAPDLKLSKVENGIVISWKIENFQEDNYEEIASYQLYAYQETQSPPSTSLWKKIGDVKALPLPMACTLTQFMAGFKYYFAVRAVDVKHRFGPFSLPGSILLLNTL